MAKEVDIEIKTEDVEPLPRWARVAFAARCARRVLPLYKHLWREAPADHVAALNEAWTLAQSAAADPNERRLATAHLVAERTGAAVAAVRAGAGAVAAMGASRVGAAAAANAAALAATAASLAADADAANAATRGTRAAARAAAFDLSAYAAAQAAMRRDLDLLKALAAQLGWTDESPVDADLLGPLWPEGEPEGWPEAEAAKPKPFRFVLDPGDADAETIREVLTALSDLHEAHTGYVLTYQEEGCLIAIPQEVDA